LTPRATPSDWVRPITDIAGFAWSVGCSLVSLIAEGDAPPGLEKAKGQSGFMMGVTTIRETQ
jgi:hypothetical protein